VPANNLPELIALVKANPNAYSYGSDGNGTASHLTMELLKAKGGFNATHVPYKGGAPMVTDLLGGQIQIGITGLPAVQQQVKAGTLKLVLLCGPAVFSGVALVAGGHEISLAVKPSSGVGVHVIDHGTEMIQ